MGTERSGALLREARRRAGLSQVELGRRAGVTQSVVSAYESGARQPSIPTLEKLIEAAGSALEINVRSPRPTPSVVEGLLGKRLARHRRKVREVAASYGLTNVRVFGSVARGEDTSTSDIDLLVDVSPGVSLVRIARCQRDLEALLGTTVDLVPASDLKPGVVAAVLADAVAL